MIPVPCHCRSGIGTVPARSPYFRRCYVGSADSLTGRDAAVAVAAVADDDCWMNFGHRCCCCSGGVRPGKSRPTRLDPSGCAGSGREDSGADNPTDSIPIGKEGYFETILF